ncbi:MAG: hypothetical protein ABWY18_18370 [Tardiphaga sp.]
MANIPNLNDPYRTDPLGETPRDPIQLNNDLQPDPQLAEGRAGGGRIVIYAAAAVVLLGAVFYGLNSGTTPNDASRTASTAPTTQDSAPKAPAPTNNIADSNSRPPVAPGVRDVTPSNTDGGVTTGSAPANPQAPQSRPTGTEVDRSKGSTQ